MSVSTDWYSGIVQNRKQSSTTWFHFLWCHLSREWTERNKKLCSNRSTLLCADEILATRFTLLVLRMQGIKHPHIGKRKRKKTAAKAKTLTLIHPYQSKYNRKKTETTRFNNYWGNYPFNDPFQTAMLAAARFNASSRFYPSSGNLARFIDLITALCCSVGDGGGTHRKDLRLKITLFHSMWSMSITLDCFTRSV